VKKWCGINIGVEITRLITMKNYKKPTIFSLSSAPGKAGVSVFRISGPKALKTAENLTKQTNFEPRRVRLKKIYNKNNELIDSCLLFFMQAPKSFTGEDCVELHVHGSVAVIEKLTTELYGLGLRQAAAGEFTRRAFENGKIDLTEAEGLADLIDAETEGQHKQAIKQMDGALRNLYEGWRQNLLNALAQIEGEIDFPDEEDVPNNLSHKALPYLNLVLEGSEKVLKTAEIGEAIRHGLDIVIIGSPNTGKSTILNGLSKRDVAIVTPTAGTTRDIISINMILKGIPVRLSDTAGIRNTTNEIEAEGIDRALKLSKKADILIYVIDLNETGSSKNINDHISDDDIVVYNKADKYKKQTTLKSSISPNEIKISALKDEDIDDLRLLLEKVISKKYTIGSEPTLTRVRHRNCVSDMYLSTKRAVGCLNRSPELAGDDIRSALHSLEELAGISDIESVFDLIFSRFCVGK
jgi:tRNA modification GTPase